MMVRVGALVTLELPDDSPVLSMPWIITFGPLDDDGEWEPVVVGPYERPHALALAEEVVADDDALMAVVEPVLPFTSVDDIRAEIASARELAEEEADADEDTDADLDIDLHEGDEEDEEFDDEDLDEEDEDLDDEDFEDDEDEDLDDDEDVEEFDDDEAPVHAVAPTPEEIRAGFARIAARLTATE
jgi:hypothetical protein